MRYPYGARSTHANLSTVGSDFENLINLVPSSKKCQRTFTQLAVRTASVRTTWHPACHRSRTSPSQTSRGCPGCRAVLCIVVCISKHMYTHRTHHARTSRDVHRQLRLERAIEDASAADDVRTTVVCALVLAAALAGKHAVAAVARELAHGQHRAKRSLVSRVERQQRANLRPRVRQVHYTSAHSSSPAAATHRDVPAGSAGAPWCRTSPLPFCRHRSRSHADSGTGRADYSPPSASCSAPRHQKTLRTTAPCSGTGAASV